MNTKPTLKLVIFLLLPLSLIPILSGWIGDIIREWVKNGALCWTDYFFLSVSIVAILMLAYFIIWRGKRYLPVQKIKQSDDVPMRKVVIAMLSPVVGLEPPGKGEHESTWSAKDRVTEKEVSLDGLTLDQVIEPKGKMPSMTWQQTLRAAYHHKDKLEKLVLIGSIGGSGEQEQLRLAYKFFPHYFPEVKIQIMGADANGENFDTKWQADFENLDDLRGLLAEILKELQKEGYKQKDIIIDCTGGLKMTSIASVLMTLDKPDLACQYVRTFGDNVGKVLGFNAVTEPRGIQP